MLVGHYAVGLAAKRLHPGVSLGTWILAAMGADLLWCVFMLAGLEHVRFGAGRGAANYLIASNIALSHSLAMDTIWAALFASACFLLRRSRRAAWLLFAVFLSHWLLDLASHRPDLPVAPATHNYFGLGLWTSVPATVLVEGGLWLAAIVLFVRAFPQKGPVTLVFWAVIAFLTLAWYNNIAGPPPPDPRWAPLSSSIFFSLTVVWAYWTNPLVQSRGQSPSL